MDQTAKNHRAAGTRDLPRLAIGEPDQQHVHPPHQQGSRRVVDYYSETRSDYELWSRRLNMHFGFWRSRMSLIDREAMLEQMNIEVIDRLQLFGKASSIVCDLGCGAGTAARSVQRTVPGSKVVGMTLVPWQARYAPVLAAHESELAPPIVLGDYTNAPLRSGSFDGVYAIESSCYAPGLGKRPLVDEMARILKPGGRVVIADAMLKQRQIASPLSRMAHQAICQAWALDTLGHVGSVVTSLTEAGFGDVVVEDISINVLPSVLHIPDVTAKFSMLAMSRGTKVSAARWLNAYVGVPLAMFASDPRAGGYYFVSATRIR